MSTALSGLRAAQTGLSTTSNNIANVDTEGYNRQSMSLSQASGSFAGGLFSGSGVNVDGVQRQYQQYLSAQLNDATGDLGASESHLAQIGQIDNLLADDDAGLNTSMQSFFAGLQTVADSPADASARQALLGNAESMTARFRATDGYLKNMGENTVAQMRGAVDEINSYASQIAELNVQISQTRAKTGAEPNGMLDQRDLALSKLSELAGVSMYQQDGHYNVSLPTGDMLVAGDRAQSLEMTDSRSDPTREVVALRATSGTLAELDEQALEGGTLGGLIQFRTQSLDSTQQRLDQMAHVLSTRLNQLHESGRDLQGNAGITLFETSTPAVSANSRNQGEGVPTVSFAPESGADSTENMSRVAAGNYRLTVDQSQDQGYILTRQSDGQEVSAADVGIEIEGVAGLEEGDRYIIKPVAGAAGALEINDAVTPEKIAARGGDTQEGVRGNSNALAMANVQSERLINGSSTLNTAYASMTSDVGNRTATLQDRNESQTQITQEIKSAQQSYSGVNMDEEAANMLKFQQYYSANAQMIRASSEMFDTLLGVMR